MRLIYDALPGGPIGADAIYECSAAAEWFWCGEKVLDPKAGDMGRMRPGYRFSWWEFTMPEWRFLHFTPEGGGPGWYRGNGESYGAMIAVVDGPPEGPDIVLSMGLFASSAEVGVIPLPANVMCPLTRLGDWSCWADGNMDMKVSDLSDRGGFLTPETVPTIGTTAECFLAAIGLANARNIEVTEHQVPPKVVAKRSKRIGRPAASSYRVIHLPSSARAARPGSTMTAAERTMRRVRGHLKTYTEDAPLLGKHVGSWWWSDRVVDLEAGPTDYTVGPPGDA